MEEYLASLEGKSESTRQAYGRDLARLEECFGKKCLPFVTASELRDYFAQIAREASASSLARALSAIRGYYGFLREREIVSENPMEGIGIHDFSPRKMPVLDGEDFGRLMQLSAFGIRGKRDMAMIALLCETGIRVSELVELDRSDFDPQGQTVRCGKGKHFRVLSISPATCRLLEQYLPLAILLAPKENAFFLGSTNRRLTRQGFWRILREHGEKMGIEDCTPQILRQSFARLLLHQGEARGQVKSLLGNGSDGKLRNYEKEGKEKYKWDC